jgi:type II secretory pathway pseudopilin PulG
MQSKIIIVVAIITLAAMAALILYNLDVSARNIKEQKDKALRVAEEAIEKAFIKIAENPDWEQGFAKDSSRGVEFEVKVQAVAGQPDLKEIISIARIGDVERKIISRFKIVEEDSTKRPEKVPGGYIIQ